MTSYEVASYPKYQKFVNTEISPLGRGLNLLRLRVKKAVP
jgi:hypothetical protein